MTKKIEESTAAFPSKEWQQACPADVGMDGGLLDRGLNELGSKAGNVMVVRHGHVVSCRGNVSKPVPQFSASKTLTAMVFAHLKQEGKADYDDAVPCSDTPSGPLATFRHFLSMTSDYGLTPHEPGRHYAYNNNAIHFYGQYMKNAFFPGLSNVGVVTGAYFDAIGRQDDIRFEGQWGGWFGGFTVSARDMARAGYLVLRGGRWNAQQVISEDYCQQVFRPQIAPDATPSFSRGPWDKFNQHRFTLPLAGNYSFGWWLWDRRGEQADVAYMSGRGGNMVILCRSLDLLIAVANNEVEEFPPFASYLAKVRPAIVE